MEIIKHFVLSVSLSSLFVIPAVRTRDLHMAYDTAKAWAGQTN